MGAPPIFTGSSSYSKDLQNVITRAVSIASLPITQLTNDKASLTKQSDELKTFDTKVAAVRSAGAELRPTPASTFDSMVSDPSVLSVTTGPGAVEGNYSILVSDAGAYSTMMTKTWVDPGGAPATYKVWIGTDSFDVTGADNSAASVAAGINKALGDKVHAAVVNVGPADTPDYRISLQSVALTANTLDLTNGGSLADQQTAGKRAQYQVNNSGVTVSSDSRTISIADGLTFTLLKSSVQAVNVTVTRSTSALNTALEKFVEAYNGVVSELDAQRGEENGPLEGSPVVSMLSSAITGLATYTNSGAFSGLRDMGVELQKDGTLMQNQFQLMAMDLKNSAGVTSFFSSFVTAAGGILDGVQQATTGILPKAESDVDSQVTSLKKTIEDKQAKVDDLQQRLIEQMSAADALLATMEQKYNYMYNMFSAMQTAAGQYK